MTTSDILAIAWIYEISAFLYINIAINFLHTVVKVVHDNYRRRLERCRYIQWPGLLSCVCSLMCSPCNVDLCPIFPFISEHSKPNSTLKSYPPSLFWHFFSFPFAPCFTDFTYSKYPAYLNLSILFPLPSYFPNLSLLSFLNSCPPHHHRRGSHSSHRSQTSHDRSTITSSTLTFKLCWRLHSSLFNISA